MHALNVNFAQIPCKEFSHREIITVALILAGHETKKAIYNDFIYFPKQVLKYIMDI